MRCDRMAEMEDMWRYRETCVETKRSREGDVSVRCSKKKKLDEITPRHVIGVVVEYEFFSLLCRGVVG